MSTYAYAIALHAPEIFGNIWGQSKIFGVKIFGVRVKTTKEFLL